MKKHKSEIQKTPKSPGLPVEFCYFNCSAQATLHENVIVIITHKVVKKASTVSDVSKLYCTVCDSLPSAAQYTDKLYTCAEVQSLVNKCLWYLLSCRINYIGSCHLQVS